MVGAPDRTIGGLLSSRRRQHFVGRRAELDLFRSALEATGDDGFRLLHLSGPGGVGKTTLLDAFADAARAGDRCVVRIDGRDLPPAPSAVLDALAGTLQVSAGEAPIMVPGPGPLVLLVDEYDRLGALDGWFRDRLLPRLPASTVTVLAGRSMPPPEWRADPAWAERLRVIGLRNLPGDDARTYLARRDVSADRHADILGATYGHPLALSLLADAHLRDPGFDPAALSEDVVRGLLQRLVAEVPSPTYRRALEAAAVARTTNEELLRGVLPDPADAHDAFGWLAGLPFVEHCPGGLMPHDLARDVVEADLRWRDPEGYREVFRSVQRRMLARVRASTGRAQQVAIADLKFCFRNLRSVLAPIAWGSWGDHYPDVAQPGDRTAIIDLVRAAEGADSAAVAEHWLDRQPGAFHVLRNPDASVRGLIVLLDLTAAGPADRDVDPGVAAAWEFVQRTAPPRAGEVVTQCRFVVDAEAYQDPSPTLNAVPILTLQRQLATAQLAWDFVTLAEPDRWTAFFDAADMARALGADFDVGGRRFGTFGHDFRRIPVEAMTLRWTERTLADDSPLPDVPEPDLLVLAHVDFDAAVRQGLRDLHRPDLLARNPLLRTRLLAESGEPADPAGLESLLRRAVAALGDDPRDDRLLRAVDRTHVQGARTQEAAAAALDLPFSSYRRHLRRGLDRVVASLWGRELGTGGAVGPDGPRSTTSGQE